MNNKEGRTNDVSFRSDNVLGRSIDIEGYAVNFMTPAGDLESCHSLWGSPNPQDDD